MKQLLHNKRTLVLMCGSLIAISLLLLGINQRLNLRSQASSSATLEPENGILSGNVSITNDQGATGGKYIQFPTQIAQKPTCTDKLQDKITAAAVGQTILVRTDCIYRETVAVNKSLVLDGQGGAEIRGSDIWGNADWTQSGTLWISNKILPTFQVHGSCKSTSNGRCRWAEQVFLNGAPLYQVATGITPASGQFSVDSNRHVILADDPTDKMAEVTIRKSWMYGKADNVTVRGFTMKHSGNAAQSGGIQTYQYGGSDHPKYSNWVIENNTLSDAHGAVLSSSGGTNNIIRNNTIARGGDLGIHANNNNIQIIGNTIFNNNTEEYSAGWEAGGVKVAGLNGALIEGNTSYDNDGPGLWCDGDCKNVTYRKNRVHHNKGIGIFFEISDGALITENIVYENGWVDGSHSWAYESGILISSSSNAEVSNNIVAWNGDGISVISQCRTNSGDCLDLTHRWNNVKGNYIHDNSIIMSPDPVAPYNNFTLAYARDIKDANGVAYMYMYSAEANNRGANNRYWFPQPDASPKLRFAWTSGYQKIADFNATPGEDNGSYMSDAEKNQILQNANIPLTPQAH